MLAYKLLRQRRDGTLGSLFIGRKARLPTGKWLKSEGIPTPGFMPRSGWHCLPQPKAPHLKLTDERSWYLVEIKGVSKVQRPEAQGGTWLLAKHMKILRRASGA